MLKRQRRLRRPGDIARVYRRGSMGGAPGLSVRAARGGLVDSRIAIVVPKKISKKAVVRNRLRRRLAEVIAAEWQTLAPGCDIVITVRDDLSNLPVVELRQRLIAALRSSRALH